LTSRADRKYDQ